MSTFRPGNIEVDERSTSGLARHPNPSPRWPDENLWKERIEYWLRLIARRSRVGRQVLNEIERSLTLRDRPRVYLNRHTRHDSAWTDGPILPGSVSNPTAETAIFITYSPPDSYGLPTNLRPAEYPPSVLIHELVHALMSIHGLNRILEPNGQQRRIGTWTSAAYPNHNEFCAVTIQNMMLSEKGAVLNDGYNVDDPTIQSRPMQNRPRGPFGLRGQTRTDLSSFVRRYAPPLLFLKSRMPGFTRRLASLNRVAFNPFLELRRQQNESNTRHLRHRY